MKSWLQKKWNNGKMLAELKPAFFLSLTFCFMIFYMHLWNSILIMWMNFGMMFIYFFLLL